MIKVEEYLKKKCLPDNEWIVINCPLAFMQQKQHLRSLESHISWSPKNLIVLD